MNSLALTRCLPVGLEITASVSVDSIILFLDIPCSRWFRDLVTAQSIFVVAVVAAIHLTPVCYFSKCLWKMETDKFCLTDGLSGTHAPTHTHTRTHRNSCKHMHTHKHTHTREQLQTHNGNHPHTHTRALRF